LQVAFELDHATHVQAILLDVTGRQVWQHSQQLPAGAHVLGLPAARLAAGTYYLQVVAGAHSASQRIQVLP
jgi:DNA-binding PucR family transcriptional regulator